MYPQILEELINKLKKMPGIGRKSAERIAFYILKMSCAEVDSLISFMQKVNKGLFHCKVCNNLCESEFCSICRNSSRNRSAVCVVENPQDIEVIEKSAVYKGLYYVLWGAISPLQGVAPQDLKIEKLISYLKEGRIKEVIIATNFTSEGETTAFFLSKTIANLKKEIKITRLSQGIPMGSSLEYLDEATIGRAIELRR